MVAALAVMATVGGPAAPAAADVNADTYRVLRVCDTTACYIAWGVVDSDGDGVCNADEVQAGTDPYDATSRPGLVVIAELLIARELPSFEYGLGALLAFPEELIALREKLAFDPFGAFSLEARPDALTRMGISKDLLAEMGISADRDAFSIGLDLPGSGDGVRPGVRVAGIDVSLLSAGKPNPYAAHGGVVGTYSDWNGGTVTEYADGSTRTVTPIDSGVKTETTNANGDKGSTHIEQGGSHKDGPITVYVKDEQNLDKDDNLTDKSHSESHVLSDKSVSTHTVKEEFVRDEDGKVVGVIITESLDYVSADGSFSSHAETKSVCDSNGANCSERSTYEETDNGEYVDPDQAYQPIVTQEAVDGVLRVRGAAVRVVEGWHAPTVDDPENPRDPGTIMLVDDTLGELYVLTEPRRVTAEPETDPGLPSPRENVTGPPSTGGCEGLC